jgi:hypothetical protein
MFIPLNNTVLKIMESNPYQEKERQDIHHIFEKNEILRIFNSYDKGKQGSIRKSDITFIFNDLKETIEKNKITINDKKYMDVQLELFINSDDRVAIENIKKSFSKILIIKKENLFFKENLKVKLFFFNKFHIIIAQT